MKGTIHIGICAALLFSGLINCSQAAEGQLAPEPDGKVSTWIEALGAEEFAERNSAELELLKLGKAAAPEVRKALQHKDAEIRRRAQHILEVLEPLLMLSVTAEGEARVGKPIQFKVRVKNTSEKEQTVVRSLDGSMHGSRYPVITVQIAPDPASDADAEKPGARKRMCGNCNTLSAEDLVTLKPAEEFDPFGESGHGQGGFGRDWLNWTPTQKGRATVTVRIDYAPEDPALWNGPVERAVGLGGLEERLATVPKVKLEGKVEIQVQP